MYGQRNTEAVRRIYDLRRRVHAADHAGARMHVAAHAGRRLHATDLRRA